MIAEIYPGLRILERMAYKRQLQTNLLPACNSDFDTALVLDFKSLREAVNSIPESTERVFMPGGDRPLFMHLESSLPLLNILKTKGVISIKLGGLVLEDVGLRISELKSKIPQN